MDNQKYCYQFVMGPWKSNYILRGYDPRVNSSSNLHQNVESYPSQKKFTLYDRPNPIKNRSRVIMMKNHEVKNLVRKSKKQKLPNKANGWFNLITTLAIKELTKICSNS